MSLFTTPSHSQHFFIYHKIRSWYKLDISETDFHDPQTVLKESEKRASEIYGTKATRYLTNGSTSGIIGAVLSCVKPGENGLIWDKAHPCHKNAVELSGANPIFYKLNNDKEWGVPARVEPEDISPYLEQNKIAAVIVTSPTYEGFASDIKALQATCRKYNTYLIVDEAHGALYPFSDKLPQSAVKIADFTVQSLHKTAGGINPTALLHTNTTLDIDKALAKINTTSPSYPMLASIEKNINFLNSSKGEKHINNLINAIMNLRKSCNNCDFGGDDITKILVKCKNLTGYELSEKLYSQYGIEDEKTNEHSTMLLCGIGTSEAKLKRLSKALRKISSD